jgi:hypothetical protein
MSATVTATASPAASVLHPSAVAVQPSTATSAFQPAVHPLSAITAIPEATLAWPEVAMPAATAADLPTKALSVTAQPASSSLFGPAADVVATAAAVESAIAPTSAASRQQQEQQLQPPEEVVCRNIETSIMISRVTTTTTAILTTVPLS